MTTLSHVLWLGGGCGAGKTTLATRLAYRFDLRLYRVDSFAYNHEARHDPNRHPLTHRLSRKTHMQRNVDPPAERLAEQFIAVAAERFELIVADLMARADGPLVLAEGPGLFPEQVAPLAESRAHMLWLLPTPAFGDRNVAARGGVQVADDAAAAHRKRAERDVLLTAVIEREADRLGVPTFNVDGSLDLAQTENWLAEHYAPAILAGPRIRDGAQRAAMRRAENAELQAQVTAHLEWLGGKAPAVAAPVRYACECRTLGCGATVSMSPMDYPAAGAVLAPHE
jgi:hypothetical protein